MTKIVLYANERLVATITDNIDSDTIETTLALPLGVYTITGSVYFDDGYVSTIGIINANISNSAEKSNYKIISPVNYDSFYVNEIIDFNISDTSYSNIPVSGKPNIEFFINYLPIQTTEGNDNFQRKWISNATGDYWISGTIQFGQEDKLSLKNDVYFSVTKKPTTWQFEMGSDITFPFNQPITFIFKPKHNHNLTGKEKISNIKFYANGDEINVTNDFGDDYDFDKNPKTIELSRVWKPQKAGIYKIEGSVDVDGVVQYISKNYITIHEQVINGGNNKTAFPKTNATIELENESNFNLYPNPSKDGSFYLKFDLKKDSPASLKIFDLTGRLAYIKNNFYLTKGENKLFFEKKDINLITGVYIIELNNNEFKQTARLIME